MANKKKRPCRFCGKKFDPRGHKSHELLCKENPDIKMKALENNSSVSNVETDPSGIDIDPDNLPDIDYSGNIGDENELPDLPELEDVDNEFSEDMPEMPSPEWSAADRKDRMTVPIIQNKKALNFILWSYKIPKATRSGIMFYFFNGPYTRDHLGDALEEYRIPPQAHGSIIRMMFGDSRRNEEEEKMPVSRVDDFDDDMTADELAEKIRKKQMRDRLEELEKAKMEDLLEELRAKREKRASSTNGGNGHAAQPPGGVQYEIDQNGAIKKVTILGDGGNGGISPMMNPMMMMQQMGAQNKGPTERERQLEDEMRRMRDTIEHGNLLGRVDKTAAAAVEEAFHRYGLTGEREQVSDLDILTKSMQVLSPMGLKFGNDGSSGGATNEHDVQAKQIEVLKSETEGKYGVMKTFVESTGRKTDLLVKELTDLNATVKRLLPGQQVPGQPIPGQIPPQMPPGQYVQPQAVQPPVPQQQYRVPHYYPEQPAPQQAPQQAPQAAQTQVPQQPLHGNAGYYGPMPLDISNMEERIPDNLGE